MKPTLPRSGHLARESGPSPGGRLPVRAPGLALALCCLLAGLSHAAAAEAPFAFDAAPGRLPKDVVPTDYRIAVRPDIKARTFTGQESVRLRFRRASSTVSFNTLNLSLRHVRLDGAPVAQVDSDDATQMTTVHLARPAAPGMHGLSFDYSGLIESRPRGLYAQPYESPDGTQGLLLSTKMESVDARRMFGCWDEPAFRATFELTATLPARWAAVSNMPAAHRVVHGALATTTFRRSPRMPSYLVELTAGDLRAVSARRGSVRFGVWALRGQESQGREALANAQQILADYDDYFGMPYPLPKLDSIAIPGGFSGAMENWGAITYTSRLLLLSPASSLAQRQQAFSDQAHEIAHQWNGDLVTMGWWDDLWLNESFASWRAAKETDLRHPDWRWWEEQDADKEAAMHADAHLSSHAVQQHVTDEVQVDSTFDPIITYRKGQAVLRMLEAYLGPETFRDGVRRYIRARAFGNATSADLWIALGAASGRDVHAIASAWTEQPGFPLVEVAARCNARNRRTLTLSQRRFLSSAQERASEQGTGDWSVPLQVRLGATGAPHTVLLASPEQSLEAGNCDEPLSVDAGALGFYRVQYDPATLALNTRQFGTLPDGDRIALLDDQWALVEAGLAQLPSFLALASGMGEDLDARAWTQIAHGLAIIEYDERGSAGHDAFAAYARSLLKPLDSRLGWDATVPETPARQALRRTVITDLGLWGDPEIIAEAGRRFSRYLGDHRAIAADDQMMVFSLVGCDADESTFERLHVLARESASDDERYRYYLALAGVRDPQLARQAGTIALAPEIPPQLELLRMQMTFTLRVEHPQLAWEIFSTNADRLTAAYGHVAPIITAKFVPEGFWNSLPLDQLDAWLKARLPAEMAASIEQGMDGARSRIAEQALLVPAADAYLLTRGAGG